MGRPSIKAPADSMESNAASKVKLCKLCKCLKEALDRKQKLINLLKNLLKTKELHAFSGQQLLAVRDKGIETTENLKKEFVQTVNSVNHSIRQHARDREKIEELNATCQNRDSIVAHQEFQIKQLYARIKAKETEIQSVKDEFKMYKQQQLDNCSCGAQKKKKKKLKEQTPLCVEPLPSTSRSQDTYGGLPEGILTPASSISYPPGAHSIPDPVQSCSEWLHNTDLASPSNSCDDVPLCDVVDTNQIEAACNASASDLTRIDPPTPEGSVASPGRLENEKVEIARSLPSSMESPVKIEVHNEPPMSSIFDLPVNNESFSVVEDNVGVDYHKNSAENPKVAADSDDFGLSDMIMAPMDVSDSFDGTKQAGSQLPFKSLKSSKVQCQRGVVETTDDICSDFGEIIPKKSVSLGSFLNDLSSLKPTETKKSDFWLSAQSNSSSPCLSTTQSPGLRMCPPMLSPIRATPKKVIPVTSNAPSQEHCKIDVLPSSPIFVTPSESPTKCFSRLDSPSANSERLDDAQDKTNPSSKCLSSDEETNRIVERVSGDMMATVEKGNPSTPPIERSPAKSHVKRRANSSKSSPIVTVNTDMSELGEQTLLSPPISLSSFEELGNAASDDVEEACSAGQSCYTEISTSPPSFKTLIEKPTNCSRINKAPTLSPRKTFELENTLTPASCLLIDREVNSVPKFVAAAATVSTNELREVVPQQPSHSPIISSFVSVEGLSNASGHTVLEECSPGQSSKQELNLPISPTCKTPTETQSECSRLNEASLSYEKTIGLHDTPTSASKSLPRAMEVNNAPESCVDAKDKMVTCLIDIPKVPLKANSPSKKPFKCSSSPAKSSIFSPTLSTNESLEDLSSSDGSAVLEECSPGQSRSTELNFPISSSCKTPTEAQSDCSRFNEASLSHETTIGFHDTPPAASKYFPKAMEVNNAPESDVDAKDKMVTCLIDSPKVPLKANSPSKKPSKCSSSPAKSSIFSHTLSTNESLEDLSSSDGSAVLEECSPGLSQSTEFILPISPSCKTPTRTPTKRPRLNAASPNHGAMMDMQKTRSPASKSLFCKKGNRSAPKPRVMENVEVDTCVRAPIPSPKLRRSLRSSKASSPGHKVNPQLPARKNRHQKSPIAEESSPVKRYMTRSSIKSLVASAMPSNQVTETPGNSCIEDNVISDVDLISTKGGIPEQMTETLDAHTENHREIQNALSAPCEELLSVSLSPKPHNSLDFQGFDDADCEQSVEARKVYLDWFQRKCKTLKSSYGTVPIEEVAPIATSPVFKADNLKSFKDLKHCENTEFWAAKKPEAEDISSSLCWYFKFLSLNSSNDNSRSFFSGFTRKEIKIERDCGDSWQLPNSGGGVDPRSKVKDAQWLAWGVHRSSNEAPVGLRCCKNECRGRFCFNTSFCGRQNMFMSTCPHYDSHWAHHHHPLKPEEQPSCQFGGKSIANCCSTWSACRSEAETQNRWKLAVDLAPPKLNFRVNPNISCDVAKINPPSQPQSMCSSPKSFGPSLDTATPVIVIDDQVLHNNMSLTNQLESCKEPKKINPERVPEHSLRDEVTNSSNRQVGDESELTMSCKATPVNANDSLQHHTPQCPVQTDHCERLAKPISQIDSGFINPLCQPKSTHTKCNSNIQVTDLSPISGKALVAAETVVDKEPNLKTSSETTDKVEEVDCHRDEIVSKSGCLSAAPDFKAKVVSPSTLNSGNLCVTNDSNITKRAPQESTHSTEPFVALPETCSAQVVLDSSSSLLNCSSPEKITFVEPKARAKPKSPPKSKNEKGKLSLLGIFKRKILRGKIPFKKNPVGKELPIQQTALPEVISIRPDSKNASLEEDNLEPCQKKKRISHSLAKVEHVNPAEPKEETQALLQPLSRSTTLNANEDCQEPRELTLTTTGPSTSGADKNCSNCNAKFCSCKVEKILHAMISIPECLSPICSSPKLSRCLEVVLPVASDSVPAATVASLDDGCVAPSAKSLRQHTALAGSDIQSQLESSLNLSESSSDESDAQLDSSSASTGMPEQESIAQLNNQSENEESSAVNDEEESVTLPGNDECLHVGEKDQDSRPTTLGYPNEVTLLSEGPTNEKISLQISPGKILPPDPDLWSSFKETAIKRKNAQQQLEGVCSREGSRKLKRKLCHDSLTGILDGIVNSDHYGHVEDKLEEHGQNNGRLSPVETCDSNSMNTEFSNKKQRPGSTTGFLAAPAFGSSGAQKLEFNGKPHEPPCTTSDTLLSGANITQKRSLVNSANNQLSHLERFFNKKAPLNPVKFVPGETISTSVLIPQAPVTSHVDQMPEAESEVESDQEMVIDIESDFKTQCEQPSREEALSPPEPARPEQKSESAVQIKTSGFYTGTKCIEPSSSKIVTSVHTETCESMDTTPCDEFAGCPSQPALSGFYKSIDSTDCPQSTQPGQISDTNCDFYESGENSADSESTESSPLIRYLAEVITRQPSDDDIVPCSINIIPFSTFYPLPEEKPPNLLMGANLKKKIQDKIDNAVNEYFVTRFTSDSRNKAKAFLSKWPASHVSRSIFRVVADSKSVNPQFPKSPLDFLTPTQNKALILITALAGGNLRYFQSVLTVLENNLIQSPMRPDSKSKNSVTNLATIYAMLCRCHGFLLRAQSFIYDLLYTRQLTVFIIFHRIVSLCPTAFPKADFKMGPLAFTLGYLIMKQGIYQSFSDHVLAKFCVHTCRNNLERRFGYKYPADMTRDHVVEELFSKIMYQGSDKAVVLLCKSQGYKWAYSVVQKYLFPLLVNWTEGIERDEARVIRFITILGHISRGFAEAICSIFVGKSLELLETILYQEPGLLVAEATIEALFHFQRLDCDGVAKILFNWKPKDRKVSRGCIRLVKRIVSRKPPSYWSKFSS